MPAGTTPADPHQRDERLSHYIEKGTTHGTYWRTQRSFSCRADRVFLQPTKVRPSKTYLLNRPRILLSSGRLGRARPDCLAPRHRGCLSCAYATECLIHIQPSLSRPG